MRSMTKADQSKLSGYTKLNKETESYEDTKCPRWHKHLVVRWAVPHSCFLCHKVLLKGKLLFQMLVGVGYLNVAYRTVSLISVFSAFFLHLYLRDLWQAIVHNW
jgi:hypothetical protein